MESLEIIGGNRLNGCVKIESAKNSVLPILACSILTDEEVIIKDCPKISDVLNMIKILEYLGVKTRFIGNDLIINSNGISSYSIPKFLTSELRTSVLMMGALLSRLKKADLSYPGGCEIGKRPIDIHITSLEKLNAKIIIDEDNILCSCEKIKPNKVYLPFPSVGATENIMLFSAISDGTVEIINPAREPEIRDLAKMINLMGGRVYGAGTNRIVIHGVKKLHGATIKPLVDRIEAGTFIIATIICGGDVELKGVNSENIYSFIGKVCDNSCKIYRKNDIIHISSNNRVNGFNIETGPYPSFPTDLQAQMTALACVSNGVSTIRENIFENRFRHVVELNKMGANIKVADNCAIIKGVNKLNGCEVRAMDLRGGASLVLAGLYADGKTVVNNANHIFRGYYNFDKKLKDIGANIKLKG